MFLETMGRRKINIKATLLTRNKLNSTANLRFKLLTDSDISYEEFTLVINKEENCFRPKGIIRAKEDQPRDIECDRLMGHRKVKADI